VEAKEVIDVRVVNRFTKSGRGRPSAGLPYKIQNGNFGVYLPKHFFGTLTAGHKMVIDLKTKSPREALERIEAIGVMVQLQTCKKETF
jgi:hypothetical protein